MLYGQYGTLNIKKKSSCLLSADGAGALFYFLFLPNFVDGESAYFFTFISIFFSNERANPKAKESIWRGLSNPSIHINTFICNIFSKDDRNHTAPKSFGQLSAQILRYIKVRYV